MTDYFVSRHQGTITWARSVLPHARFVSELEPAIIVSGDKVYGTLPVDIAAEACGAGARFFALVFDRDLNERGVELTLNDFGKRNPRFEEFDVRRVRPSGD